MTPTYRVDDSSGGDPIVDLELYEFIYVDDKDRLPTLTVTDEYRKEQYLCWMYLFKGVERWKICRITTKERTVLVAPLASPDYQSRTIVEQSVEYPNGYASYNFSIEDLFLHSYLPLRN